MLLEITKDDIVSIAKDDYFSLGRVIVSAEDGVQIFRDSGNVWYMFDEYQIEKLSSLDSR